MTKYTVIIPTRDRAETLVPTILSCLRQTYPNYEVIVSDNCSTDNTKDLLTQFKDTRLRYINPGRRLSMSGNFEFALRHVEDGFVMFIGADDAILPNSIEYVDSIVKKYGVYAVSCRQATYVWPNFPDSNVAGRLVFGTLRDDIEIRSSNEWLNKTLNFQVQYCFDLPNLYCGFVHKKIINKAYKNGSYFKSITPDAYSSFATAIFIDKYAFSHKPFSIAGASAKSNGASAMHPAGVPDEATKFYAENDIDFHPNFINCPSFEIIAAEAFAQLKLAFPELCILYEINYSKMLHGAIANCNTKTEAEIKAAVKVMASNFGVDMNNIPPNKQNKSLKEILLSLLFAISRLINKERIISIKKSQEFCINNIDEAALVAYALNQQISGQNFTTDKDIIKDRIRQLLKI